MYKYYLELISNEHCLFPSEIATMYKVYSNSLIAHDKLITAAIKEYIKSREIEEYKIFYETKKGLRRVYPMEIYKEAVEDMFKKALFLSRKEKHDVYKANLCGKNYSFLLAREEVLHADS